MPKVTNEFKTGIMLIVVLAIMLYFVYATIGLNVSKDGYELNVEFNFISGLRPHAPVRLCGAKVGHVEDIKVICDEDDTHVEVVLWIKDDAKIREDSKFYISTLGLMGEKYVEITSGGSGVCFLEPGCVSQGKEPFKMEDLMEKAEVMADKLEEALISVKKLSDHADDLVTSKEIDKTLKNIEATSENFKEFSDDIKKHPWKLLFKGDEEEKDSSRKRK